MGGREERGRTLLCVLGLVAVLGLAPVALAAGGASWGSAIPVPGVADLNLGGEAVVLSVSCASEGNCAAGGYYQDRPDSNGNYHQAFVASETNGVWSTALEVPGTAALNLGSYAETREVSCASPGNCAAIGFYLDAPYSDASRQSHVFVVDLANGVWGTAIEMPGTAAVRLRGTLEAYYDVSCPSAGNCAAGFDFGNHKGYVADETNGVWSPAKKLPGAAISCTSAGNCAAVGGAFAADEKNGIWGKPHRVLSSNVGAGLGVLSVSCASPGNCAAGGAYGAGSWHERAFVVSETNGKWDKAKKVALNLGPAAAVTSVSCASASSCAAGGVYSVIRQGAGYAFVIAMNNGVWRRAVDVPGIPFVYGSRVTVSCAPAGPCAAAGSTGDPARPYVLAETSAGKWQSATDVPGVSALSSGYWPGAWADTISCTTTGPCAIGGAYPDASSHVQAFVTAP